MNNPLATRIATMSTGQIKNTLETMNRKPWAQWSKDELTVENALIFELYDRNEEEWCARYEETMSL